MNCPKCKSISHVKYGTQGGLQRHRCCDCKYIYTVEFRGKPPETKKLALKLYLEGMGFRGIGRILKVSAVSVMNWIRKFGEEAAQTVELTSPAPVIEMDEIFTYIREKKTSIGYGRLLTASKNLLSLSELEPEELARALNCIRK